MAIMNKRFKINGETVTLGELAKAWLTKYNPNHDENGRFASGGGAGGGAARVGVHSRGRYKGINFEITGNRNGYGYRFDSPKGGRKEKAPSFSRAGQAEAAARAHIRTETT